MKLMAWATAENVDPTRRPEKPEPWYRLDSQEALDPWGEFDEPELPGIPLTIGPAPGGPAGPPSGTDLETGQMAAKLTWAVPKINHPQRTIRIGNAEVNVDASLAPLVSRLNAIGCNTVASCEGIGDTEWAYVMFTENGGRAFARFWNRRLVPLGYEQPVLDHELRDADWRREISRDFPFPRPIPVDPDGTSFTLLWRLYHEELRELMPDLLDALDREMQAQRHE